jgi:hypothetical protein
MTHSAVHKADRLLALLTETLGSDDEAANVLGEAMSGKPRELNLWRLVPAELLKKLGEPDS